MPARRLDLLVDDAELDRRRAEWSPPPVRYTRGYAAMFCQHVSQAHDGCDFDFLARPGTTQEPEIH